MNRLERIGERLRNFRRRIRNYFDGMMLKRYLQKIDASKQRLFLFQTPNHTNIGDHAIAQAEIDFLNTHFPDCLVVEVNQNVHVYFLKNLKSYVSKEDVVLIHGGGNFGNQYPHEEYIRRSVIQSFPSNKIVSFPQTIYFTRHGAGPAQLEKTKQIVAAHKQLTLIAREQVSYELMTSYFPGTKVLLTPDIVLSMNKIEPETNREGILMVLREDDEKVLSSDQHQTLATIADRYFDKVTYSDMHYHKGVRNKRERKEVLDFKFAQFKRAQLVITDRLHGMVLAAITQTPCIAFSNYNQKVSGTYKWVEELNYIKFVAFSDDVEVHVEELLHLEAPTPFDQSIFDQYYQQIVDAING